VPRPSGHGTVDRHAERRYATGLLPQKAANDSRPGR
jgi:hypothetical protein